MLTPKTRLMNFIGQTNILLSTKNQEVSLLWVSTVLQNMREQGYFAQLKVRWGYNLNFTGHPLLKLEYEESDTSFTDTDRDTAHPQRNTEPSGVTPKSSEEAANTSSVTMVLNSLGLGSLDGPLPLEMSQLVYHLKHGERPLNKTGQNITQAEATNKDNGQGLVAFLDLISTRMFFFYKEALERNALAPLLMRQDTSALAMLQSLTGVPLILNAEQMHAALPFMIGPAQNSLEALRLLLNKLLGIPVQVEPFSFAMYQIPVHLRSKLNHHTCILGHNIQLGSHYASFNRKFKLILGPMDIKDLNKLQPINGSKVQNIIKVLCKLVLKRPLDYSVVYLIRTESVPRIQLNLVHTLHEANETSTKTNVNQAHGDNSNESSSNKGLSNEQAISMAHETLVANEPLVSSTRAGLGGALGLGCGLMLRNRHTAKVVALVRQYNQFS